MNHCTGEREGKLSIMKNAFYFQYDSPFGKSVIVCTYKSMIYFSLRPGDLNDIHQELRRMGCAIETGTPPLGEKIKHQLDEYFQKKRKKFTIPIEFKGTPFQNKVWETLRQVPLGRVITYGELARLSGYPHAARAVGSAMAHNRIPILIPCHRVVAANGRLGGFTGGLDIKKRLLAIEEVTLPV